VPCTESERDFRVDPPKVRKLPRLRRFKELEGGDGWRGDDRCTGVGDSPTPPVLSILANGVKDVVINVGRPPRNDEEVAPRAWEDPARSRAAFIRYG
jgi:hypothetical protein